MCDFQDIAQDFIQEVYYYKTWQASINIFLMFRHDLSQLPIFRGLVAAQLDQIAPLLEAREFACQEVIFTQGQTAQYLFILIQGQVVIQYKPYDAPQIDVTHIEAGGVFGWSAALRHECYTSSAKALETSLVYQMHGADLEQLCEKHPETGKIILNRLANVIAERLRSLQLQVETMLTDGMKANGEWESENGIERNPQR